MARRPSFQFYPGDWRKDPNLRRCSPAARGAWMDMICLMFESEKCGVLETKGTPWTVKEIARECGCKPAQINELLDKGVAKRDGENGPIYSSRMIRDEELRNAREQAGSKGGSKAQANRQANTQANGQANLNPSSSSSSSPSNTRQAEEESDVNSLGLLSVCPEDRDRLDLLLKAAGIRNPTRARLVEAEGLTPEIVVQATREVEADPNVRSTTKILMYCLCERFGVAMGSTAREMEPEVREYQARLDALRAQARAT